MDAFPLSSDLLGKSASAYEHLRRAISRGRLRPGRRLSATALAETFRISETPVREALLRLSTEGFLAWEPSKGHFTKPATIEEQHDLHELIFFVLSGCFSSGRTPAGLGGLAEITARLGEPSWEEDGAGEAAAQVLGDLGGALVAASGNQVLVGLMSIVFDRTWLVRRLDLREGDRIVEARARAAGVLLALRSETPSAAIDLLSRHLNGRRQRLAELVEAANREAAQANYP